MNHPTPAARRALVLGAGGVLGFAWTLGALDAVQDIAGFAVGDVEVVLGTSAGSVGAALLGCGVSLDVLLRHHRGIPAPADLQITYDHETGAGEALPPRPGWRPAAPRLALAAARHPRRVSPFVALTGLLPPGRGSLGEVRAMVAGVSASAGFAERWPTAPRPWIVAADHQSGRRVVFGRDAVPPRPDGSPRVVRRATLVDAVQASCSIPGWYPPTIIDGVPYVDGGAVSNSSVDLLRHTDVEQAYVLAPMASVEPDRPRSVAGRLERRIRRAVTRRIMADAEQLRARGMQVVVLTPGAAELSVMGANMMDAARRGEVLDLARVGAAGQLREQLGAGGADRHAGRRESRGRALR